MTRTEAETSFYWRMAAAAGRYFGEDPRRAASAVIDGQDAREWLDELDTYSQLVELPKLQAKARALHERLATWLAPVESAAV